MAGSAIIGRIFLYGSTLSSCVSSCSISTGSFAGDPRAFCSAAQPASTFLRVQSHACSLPTKTIRSTLETASLLVAASRVDALDATTAADAVADAASAVRFSQAVTAVDKNNKTNIEKRGMTTPFNC